MTYAWSGDMEIYNFKLPSGNISEIFKYKYFRKTSPSQNWIPTDLNVGTSGV